MTDFRPLVILAEVRDDARIVLGDTLVDVGDAVSRALENTGLDAGLIDVRPVPATGNATPFAQLVNAHLLTLPRSERFAALSLLAAVVHETRAEERRRLCTDPRALQAAMHLTCEEIDRHAVPRRTA